MTSDRRPRKTFPSPRPPMKIASTAAEDGVEAPKMSRNSRNQAVWNTRAQRPEKNRHAATGITFFMRWLALAASYAPRLVCRQSIVFRIAGPEMHGPKLLRFREKSPPPEVIPSFSPVRIASTPVEVTREQQLVATGRPPTVF